MALTSCQVAIIGAGFGGLGMAAQLKRAGVDDFVLLEKGDDVGGVWRDNTYPGAACDVPSHLYSFSFAPSARWSRHFGQQPEILGYLRSVTDRFGLRPHIRFATEVTRCTFDEDDAVWAIETAGGETIRARAIVAATGQLNRPADPRVPGLDHFQGNVFHSARWDHDHDLRGERVAVIGTGASAIQFVPEIAPEVDRLHVFQRSAPYVIERGDRFYSERRHRLFERVPLLLRLHRWAIYWNHERRVPALVYPTLGRLLLPLFRRHLEQQVPDPALRRALTPDYPIGCKRVLISDDWYPALQRDNVELVTSGLREVRERSVVSDDGSEREVDTIILGTGFNATAFLAPMTIRGRAGRDLNEAWADGAQAHLGITVSGFPNLFLIYGPNTNLGHNSIVFMIEAQIRYVLDALQRLRAGARYLDVRPAVQERFVARIEGRSQRTVWTAGCRSWYTDANGRNVTNWPGFTIGYRLATRRLRMADYEAAQP
jgi:cation diffusion facilitator CzcD-associated flavoprotein CzcO